MPALLDTGVVIAYEHVAERLPDECAIASITLAELAVGASIDGPDRDARSRRLQWARQFFEPFPFGSDSAMAYGHLVASIRRSGRKERSRIADLLIAAVASANGLPLYTTNADDFAGLDSLVEIRAV
jgi:predicted nucleic acid-binding protein